MLEWSTLLHPDIPWKDAYTRVEVEARSYLQQCTDPGEQITTSELVEGLFPEQFARGDGITARKRIFDALAALAKHQLGDCCTRGVPRKLKHRSRMVRPWLWHMPQVEFNPEATVKPGKACPHCGGML